MTNSNFTKNNQIIKPTLRVFMDNELTALSAKMNCTLIGTIQAFNATNQTATVQINYMRKISGGQYIAPSITADKFIAFPLLVNVPVIFMQGGGAYLSFPIAKGDQCLIIFCDREIDTWFNQGSQTPQPPASDRVHDMNDGFALIGMRNLKNSLANYNTKVASLTDTTGERLTQAGFLQAYAGSTAPTGWLLCYGQAVSRGTYSILFSVIGTTYGAGDGTTTFNLPDLRGRVPVGLDNMGGTDAQNLYESQNSMTNNRTTLGGAVGEAAHTQTINELVSHTHNLGYQYAQWTPPGPTNYSIPYTGGSGTTGSTGGGLAANVVQPGLMMNWIIKI